MSKTWGLVVVVAGLGMISGLVDAVSFAGKQVFVANQTGNLVLVAMSLAGEGFGDVVGYAVVALLGFAVGVLGAWWLRERIGPAVAFVEVMVLAVALGVVWAVGVGLPLIGLLALAMGVQAVIVTRAAGIGVRTVAITGSLSDVARYLVERSWALVLVAAAAPVGYALGAFSGVVLHQRNEAMAVLVAMVVAAVVAGLIPARVRGEDMG